VDDVTWGALTLSLTLLGGFYTWWAYRHRGATPAMRGLALTLLPAAAWLTGTLRMFTRIASAISDWALSLAFSPRVWLGLVFAASSVALFVISGFLRNRGIGASAGAGRPGRPGRSGRSGPPAAPKSLPRAQQQPGPLAGDDLDAEIAAILKKRGIS
jgi:hypothetical protein